MPNFRNYECDSFGNINKHVGYAGEIFLDDKNKFVRDLEKFRGYKTCHVIDGYDATKCQKDCEKYEKGELSKNCEANEGLFKCCITRHKICHSCNYCCVLPMCTWKGHMSQNTTGMTN